MLKISGRIETILPLESGVSKKTDKPWSKGGFTINTGDKYNPIVCFSLFGEEKIALTNGHNVGEEVEVAFNLSSRAWEKDGKVSYFTSADAWAINKSSGEQEPVTQEDSSDLPF